MSILRKWLPLLILAVAPVAAAGQDVPADKVVSGQITGADHEHYKEIPFDVPAGVERITVTLSYDKANKTVVDLGLWDPERFRGWSGGTRDRFTVAASDATPGYLPGAIRPGRWRVQLGVPNARRDSRSDYKVSIYFDLGDVRHASAAIADPSIKTGPGWYRGDLHMHDAHSDGSCASQSGKRIPCPLFRTVEAAAEAGLDFIAVTDHNTTAHFGGLRELQPYFDKLLLIPGIEITTFGGHANIFGPSRFVDFRIGSKQVPDIKALQREVAKAGAIMSLNHPALPSGELCMGCGWIWRDTDYAGVTAIEAINALTTAGPLAGLGFWYARLNEGHRLTGIGASDNHDPDPQQGKAPIGRPSTVVHARELSQAAILDGIRAGNVFIDVEGTRNRLLEVSAGSAAMGGELRSAGPLAVQVHVAGVAGSSAELVANGKAMKNQAITAEDQRLTFTIGSGEACGWFSVNVRNADQRPLLIGNPIYRRCDR